MPRKGHTEEQIIRALREANAGKKVSDISAPPQVLAQSAPSATAVESYLVAG